MQTYDITKTEYKVAGAKIATVDELWHPRIVARGAKLTATDRLVQGRMQGHGAQLGGVLVVARDGGVVWAHLSEDASDDPPTEEVLEAARKAADTA